MEHDNEYYQHPSKNVIIILMIAIAISLLTAGSAGAHKVWIYAWVEGNTIFTESKFSGGKNVNQGEVIVYDFKGNQLLKGKTSRNGEFAFKVPKNEALKIVINAGMGHRAEWKIGEEEFETAAGKPGKKRPLKKIPEDVQKDVEKHLTIKRHISRNEIRLIVEQALDKKLKPIMSMLKKSMGNSTSLKDILGGIGYIIGLIGLVAYLHYRRKIKEAEE